MQKRVDDFGLDVASLAVLRGRAGPGRRRGRANKRAAAFHLHGDGTKPAATRSTMSRHTHQPAALCRRRPATTGAPQHLVLIVMIYGRHLTNGREPEAHTRDQPQCRAGLSRRLTHALTLHPPTLSVIGRARFGATRPGKRFYNARLARARSLFVCRLEGGPD
jgi:hypothetical protein